MHIELFEQADVKKLLAKFSIKPFKSFSITLRKTITPDSWLLGLNIDDELYVLYEEDHFEDLAHIKSEVEDSLDFIEVTDFIMAADVNSGETDEALLYTVVTDEDAEDRDSTITSLMRIKRTKI